ncbi:MAG: magnesium transporter [Acidobacteria bacterium]|nr:magnesium transporter [Acidobacteriota bacterium]NIM63144.1 magnesium transporter [Acidobacteriota bacterium]NIQ86465.1 magnesium transporter [Acidobacteriota bacterium]NIT10810.1 magnesium transporter [Acidobacteriota bacterium]
MESAPWIELQRLVKTVDNERVTRFLEELSPLEVARCVSRLGDADRVRLFSMLEPDHAATVAEQIPDVQAANAIGNLEPGVAAAILEEMPTADRADLLGDVEEPIAEAILGEMDSRQAEATRTLREYPGDVAGGLMTLEYLAYPETNTVGDVLSDLRKHAQARRDYVVQYAFVTTDRGRLVGVLRLRDLLFARMSTPLRSLMIEAPLSLYELAPLDEVRACFDSHNLHGVPVVNSTGRLVGMIRRAAVSEALAERGQAAFLKTQGIVGGEELRTMPVFQRSRRRLAWLSVNILLNILAASVIAFYQDILTAVIALAVFLPIISDMSGCSGNQAVAVSMRELSLGLVRPSEVGRVWLKELAVGWINGVALGVLIATVAWLWQGTPLLGMVVGSAMMLNTVVAVSIGGTVPLLLRRWGLDPALASGPILTTVTDMCGFFLLLSMAAALLSTS